MTSLHITTQHQREQIEKLAKLNRLRSQDEVAIRERATARSAETAANYQRTRDQAIAEFEREHAKLVASYKEIREATFVRYEGEGFTLKTEEDRQLAQSHKENAEIQKVARLELRQKLADVKDSATKRDVGLQQAFAHYQQQHAAREDELAALENETRQVASRRCEWPASAVAASPPAPNLTQQEYLERLSAAYVRASNVLLELRSHKSARFLQDGWPILIFLFTLVAAAYPCWLASASFGWPVAIAAGLALAFVITLVVRQVVAGVSKKAALAVIPRFQAEIAQGRAELAAAYQAAVAFRDTKLKEVATQREQELKTSQTEAEAAMRDKLAEGQAKIDATTQRLRELRKKIEDTYEHKLQQIEDTYPKQIRDCEQAFEKKLLAIAADYRQRRDTDQAALRDEWRALVTQWSVGLHDFQNDVVAMQRFCDTYFPAWKNDFWRQFAAPITKDAAVVPGPSKNGSDSVITALRIGHFDFDMAALPGGLPHAEGLDMPAASFQLPVVLSYPECPSLLLEAEGEGRDIATDVIQNVMLRLLTSFPPGKVRFTILDPVGLGQNFSAFMHLADFDERLVHSRIWTESQHISQRLVDLSEHMENVIQKYLRNEFASILDYNEHAGEVAEPFQILVVANFPANFSEESARRLVSIASSGARCGVYTLISVDSRMKLPRNLELADLEAQATTLIWNEESRRFSWKHDDLRPWPLTLEAPPDDERLTSILKAVGQRAKESSRVEVPFEMVSLPPEKWWTHDSREQVEVPLGRAGAKKLQPLRLGKGTSQHVLIAGKTGSGKSTLLNAMITNLAVHYSPEELWFYLIDFKKGVEFKAYAANRLPHARVIAIESEREFGLSVLERLDVELKNRGDLFRKHGVQDVKGYRNANPGERMPRILLIIDEFQEFFTSDDKIAHDAGLLLDRLVRQGRAFGIHVLLGSQTLAGAYSLARSTIGQMAVRIALQCSESDSHLILSEDNTAARLLSRPGEAIYNDANGLLEGNHPFQVVWLSDHLREDYLRRVYEMSEQRGVEVPTPIVFEGNVAADPRDNDLLREVIRNPAARGKTPRAWLGAAVAIKEPTEVVFHRQGGRNLLIVGQQEELSMGILSSCLVALAATRGDTDSTPTAETEPTAESLRDFYILDGTRDDAPTAGYWKDVASQLALGAAVVPPRRAAATVVQLAEEVTRRMNAGESNSPPIFLVVYNLARFRELKKADDFSFSSFGAEEEANAGKQMATILREGPSVGVHVLVWADSFSNASRWIDRQSLRDFEMRVLFQMSATDSSNLMDSPAASRLGTHMALFFSEEQGQSEKFRPYGPPAADWLTSIRSAIHPHADVQ